MLSQKELSKLSGVSASYINDIECHRKCPSLTIVEKLCKVLKHDACEMIMDHYQERKIHDMIIKIRNDVHHYVDMAIDKNLIIKGDRKYD